MKLKFLLVFLSILNFLRGYPQCPIADFSIKNTACLNETISIKSLSPSPQAIEWDFCDGSADNVPNVSFAAGLSGGANATDLKLVLDNSTKKYYAFIVSNGNNKIFRMSFGMDPSNPSTQTEVIIKNTNISSAIGMDLYQEQGSFYALVTASDGYVHVLSFDSGIEKNPTEINKILISTPLNHVSLMNDNGNLYAFVTGGNMLSVINFGLSITNSASVSSFNVPTPFILGFTLVRECDQRLLLTVGSELTICNFGTNYSNTPVFNNVTGLPATSLINIKVAKSKGKYIAFIPTDNSGQFLKVDLGNSLLGSIIPTVTNFGNFGFVYGNYGFDIVKFGAKYFAYGIGYYDNILSLYDFPKSCNLFDNFSGNLQPSVSYQIAGTYSVTSFITDITGNISSKTYTVIVSSNLAPDIIIQKNENCIVNSSTFNAVSSNGSAIQSFNWSFGDGSNSTQAAPGHLYALAGYYPVTLSVIFPNGCENIAQTAIQIFNPPQANFSLPVSNPICTNQNYLFTNTSVYDSGSNPTWQWSVNGTTVSTNQDLSYLFNSNSDQTITLTASIPGCSTQSTQTVTSIQNGPLLSFTSPATSCVGTSVNFNNTSSGSVLGYNWNFGNGNSSTQTNPSNSFNVSGIYNVTLSASNASGCQNSFSKPINIYSNPQPDFSIDLPPFSCSGSPSQFNDLTPALTDSNLTTWNWQFGDVASGSSTLKNPAYTYASASNYNVTLQVASNFGCTGSIQKTITISSSPIAAFTNSAACLNQATQFTDASTGSIKSWQWKMPGVANPINTQNTTFTFKSSATLPVTLTVTGTNNCINQITKNIVVPVAPVVDFSILYPCTGNATKFQETNPGGNDPAVSWSWNFSAGTGTGNPANYTFSSAGLYTVSLTSTRQSQCAYSVSKNLSIIEGPVASFIPSSSGGGAPLSVTFNNNSAFADAYSWNFGDANNSSSSEVSPSFTYTQLGAYTVTLTASNSQNCTHAKTALIDVVVPNVDAALGAFTLADDPSTGSKRAIVTIKNNGNISFLNPVVSMNLGGNVSIKETVVGMISVGGSLSKTLNLEIVPTQISYVCAKVIVAADVFADNDEQCVSLAQDEVVLSPYPNPASSGFTIDWITTSAQEVRVSVFKTNGQIAFDQTVSAPSGLTQYKIETSSWASGLYLVRVIGSNSEKVFRVAVAN